MPEGFLERGGLKLWFTWDGEGPPMLLLNGGAGCCDYLGPVAALIHGRRRVYRLEERGCGRSDRADAYGLEASRSDIEALREHLGLEGWTAGGHCWGADLAHPERVSALAYLCGTGIQNDREWKAAYEEGLAAGRKVSSSSPTPSTPR